MLKPSRRPAADIRADLKALDDLQSSRAWAMIQAALAADIEAATQALVSLGLTEADLRNRAGRLGAALAFRDIVATLRAQLDTELALVPKPATAGNKEP